MRKKVFILFSLLIFISTGCSSDSNINQDDNNSISNNTNKPVIDADLNNTTVTNNMVDTIFYNEYVKYVVNAPDNYSIQANKNIKSLIQNITGRGKMPQSVGMGEITNKFAALAVSKKISDAFSLSKEPGVSQLVKYEVLNTKDDVFMKTVMDGMLSGIDGIALLMSLKEYGKNQQYFEYAVKEHIALFKKDKKTVYKSALTNLPYLYGYIIDNMFDLKITALPQQNDEKMNKIVDVVYNHCKGKQNNQNIVETYNMDSKNFRIENIIYCDNKLSEQEKWNNKFEFMEKIGKIFDPNFVYEPLNMPKPENTDPNKPTPDKPTPDKPTPDKPTPDKPDPDITDPDKPTPDKPGPDKPDPDTTDTDKPTPDKSDPDTTVPGITNPENPLSEVNQPESNAGQVVSKDVVDDAFYQEYKKYVHGGPAEFSSYAVASIKSLFQNITGRGMMPSFVGIGNIDHKYVALAISKTIADKFKISQNSDVSQLLDYAYLDVYSWNFIRYVMGALMGADGKALLKVLKPYAKNQAVIEELLKAHVKLFNKSGHVVNENGYTNIAYFYAGITEYFEKLKITELPKDAAKIQALTEAVYNHCKNENNNPNVIDSYNGETTKFKNSTIITCGTESINGSHMIDFMNKVGKVFNPDYTYSPN